MVNVVENTVSALANINLAVQIRSILAESCV